MKLPVTILAVGASYSYDMSGPTHHSIDDIAILRTLGNFEIYSPSDNKLKNSLTRLGIRDENLYSYLERSKNQEKNNIDKSSIKKIIKKILNK